MQRVRAGDREAFALLFDLHSGAVLGLLVRMLRTRSEAEEVVQDVFLHAWRRAEDFDGRRASPRGWLLMLARSRALDRIRSRRSRRRREERVATERPGSGNPAVAAVGSTRLERAERHESLGSALADLPPEQRTAIELAYFEGLTMSQIADRTGAPVGTVKSRVLLGLRKLRRRLREGG